MSTSKGPRMLQLCMVTDIQAALTPPPTSFSLGKIYYTTQWGPSGVLADPGRHLSIAEHGAYLPPNYAPSRSSFAGCTQGMISYYPVEDNSTYGQLTNNCHHAFRAAGSIEFGGAAAGTGIQRLPVVPSTQPGSMYSPGSPSPTDHVKIGNNSAVSNHTMSAPPSLSLDAATDERQRPVVLYHVPPKTSLGRRRGRQARAISVDGLWIDEAELVYGMNESNGIINVHECQWARSKSPCGMWVIGTKAFISSHIRKWHNTSREERNATKCQCQWGGCDARGMLKDSISRHVVSVHLGEVFFCKGCGKESPRKDVYEQHVEYNEGCRAAGAAVTHHTEIKMIDAYEALSRGGVSYHPPLKTSFVLNRWDVIARQKLYLHLGRSE
ncbi:hypothetical protein BU15DRAFT_69054 [Melanogaster broomeanus]|nr:hypothetical protein BU15DRAFT_69054 [Melanogaster broomeanus]